MTTWILTGSPDNFAATREHGFRIIGLKERNRNRALEIEPGDRIVFWLTQAQRFAGSVTVVGELFEDREKVWPGKPGKVDPYPWRFETEPEIVLEDGDHVPGEELAPRLEHVQKWPAEHWKLAFQGQIRPVGEGDAELLVDALRAAAGRRSGAAGARS
ncbi:MAG TPA: EVE domain-containing protein [Solirubrobacteraceae bacterium]|nr:EVE domain-containing protein [Solirubrobacteraceae bacterium]